MKVPALYRLFFAFAVVSLACNISNPRGLTPTIPLQPTVDPLGTAFAIVTLTEAAYTPLAGNIPATPTFLPGTGTPSIPVTGATSAPASTPILSGSTWPQLQLGNQGPEVYALQSLLRHHGHSVTVDSVFSEQTQAAVGNFQGRRGMSPSGIVDAQTFLALIQIGSVQRGQRGFAVSAVQHLLALKFGYAVSVNGTFDSSTDAALKDFQQNHGLTVDGFVGAETWQALFSLAPP